jgi:heme A synthase
MEGRTSERDLRPWLRILAGAAAALTLLLITVGGLVTNTDSGLACPDWPLCFGTPFPKMVGGVLMEHGHRYLATAVGAVTALLAVGALRRGRQGLLSLPLAASSVLLLGAAFRAGAVQYASGEVPSLWAALTVAGFLGCMLTLARARGDGRLASFALLLVMAQGLLGGLTVIYRLPVTVLVLHLAASMLFLATAVLLWLRLGAAPRIAIGGRGLLWAATGALYVQIVLGATVRHTGAGLVCTDLPLCRGALWPSGVHPAVHLHMAHRALAFLVAGLLVAVCVQLVRAGVSGVVRALALALPVLVLAQIALGMATIVTFKETVPVTAHLLVAALLLADCVGLLSLTAPAEVAAAVADAAEDATAPSVARTRPA